MKIRGRRIHIAGSARADIDPQLLKYGHELIDALVKALAGKGANFLVGTGREPRTPSEPSGIPMIFDWTVIATVHDCLKSGHASPSNWQGRILATVATSKTHEQIPKNRRVLWEQLLAQDAVQIEYIEPGWASGAVRRIRMAELGDVLVILSGGEGVEHLAREYSFQGKPVLPFDVDLGSSTSDGSGGAARLAGEMRAHLQRFFRLPDPSIGGTLVTKMATHGCQVPVKQVAQAVVDLLEAMEPPTVFYVRLLNRDSPEYLAVERFFRNVVDPVVSRAGYQIAEMGLSPSDQAWMNVQIFSTLHNSALVVADLTGLRPDCLIELGYALGRARRIIFTAKKNTSLPFDPSMLECYFWEDQTPDDIRISELEAYWYRNFNRPPVVKPRGLL